MSRATKNKKHEKTFLYLLHKGKAKKKHRKGAEIPLAVQNYSKASRISFARCLLGKRR